MKLLINNQTTEMADGATLAAVAVARALPEKGVAVAVNNRMVPRAEWETFCLKENDNITIITAACGG